jgi:translation initiation factor 1
MAKKRLEIAPTQAPALSTLGDALRARGVSVTRAAPAAAAPPAPSPADSGAPRLSNAGKVVLRRERKGHGGKTVTIIEGLGLSPVQLEAVARRMRQALGCGSRVDGTRVVLQGDLASAAEPWLRAHGATRVVQGN